MSLAYELRHGSYYLMDLDETPSRLTGERTVHTMTDEVAIAFDRIEGTLHKHGRPDVVDAWVARTRRRYQDTGFGEQAEPIVVVTGAFPVDEINRCLATSGYCLEFFRKLQSGAIQSAKTLPAAPPAATPLPPGRLEQTVDSPAGERPARSPFPHRR